MIIEKIAMLTEVVGSEDGMHTYEVRRSWADKGKKGLVIELYPTISPDRCGELDLSSMHLLNHVNDFKWSAVRIVNLYSLVCSGKPKVSELHYDENNLAYFENILEDKSISEYDIVIATGSSLKTHTDTIETKIEVLTMLRDKGLEGQIKCISVNNANKDELLGAHPLFLGLHYGREQWELKDYPLLKELKVLEESKLLKKKSDLDKTKSEAVEKKQEKPGVAKKGGSEVKDDTKKK